MCNHYSFRRFPTIRIDGCEKAFFTDNPAILQQFENLCQGRKRTVIVAECYPGVNQSELLKLLAPLKPVEIIHSDDLALSPEEIDLQIARDQTVERTGLHEREFLDTFHVSMESEVPILRNGSVHVINLVEGGRITLSIDTGHFAPFELHYAETCIVPEAAGSYKMIFTDGTPVRAVIARVRN